MYWRSPLIVQTFSIDWTELILRFYWNAELSTLSRRAFAIATPSARWNDNEPSATSWTFSSALANPKGTVQLILTCVPDNPHMHVSQSTEVMLSCGNEKRIKDLKDSFKYKKLSTKNKASLHTSLLSLHAIMKPETAPRALKPETLVRRSQTWNLKLALCALIPHSFPTCSDQYGRRQIPS